MTNCGFGGICPRHCLGG